MMFQTRNAVVKLGGVGAPSRQTPMRFTDDRDPARWATPEDDAEGTRETARDADGLDDNRTYRWSVQARARALLEQAFASDPYPRMDARQKMAADLHVTQRQVQIWFQNRRQREQRQRSLSDWQHRTRATLIVPPDQLERLHSCVTPSSAACARSDALATEQPSTGEEHVLIGPAAAGLGDPRLYAYARDGGAYLPPPPSACAQLELPTVPAFGGRCVAIGPQPPSAWPHALSIPIHVAYPAYPQGVCPSGLGMQSGCTGALFTRPQYYAPAMPPHFGQLTPGRAPPLPVHASVGMSPSWEVANSALDHSSPYS